LRRASLLALPLLLSGCSGTPFGETLSRSFSGVPTPAPATAPATAPTTVSPTPAPAALPKPAGPAGATPKPAPPKPATPAAPAAPRPANPAPYRVTILLPQADPAAPAEVLTRALRTAGVPFEVETIQRTAPGDTPRVAPAPAPLAPALPAAPSVRPAPPPR
jgi:hypothetical protein